MVGFEILRWEMISTVGYEIPRWEIVGFPACLPILDTHLPLPQEAPPPLWIPVQMGVKAR